MRNLLLILLAVILAACGDSNSNPGTTPTTLEGYEVLDIPNSKIKSVNQKSVEGNVIEEGQILNGLKTGTWVTYYPDKPYPKTIMSYTDGIANGPYFEFNNRGQLELKTFYKSNKLHGYWGQYSFGRVAKEATYKDGELNGAYREYKSTTGKVQKEISYKEGKMHGKYFYFDEEGNVSLEYTYQDGERVEE